jgi:hypothetical protein
VHPQFPPVRLDQVGELPSRHDPPRSPSLAPVRVTGAHVPGAANGHHMQL